MWDNPSNGLVDVVLLERTNDDMDVVDDGTLPLLRQNSPRESMVEGVP